MSAGFSTAAAFAAITRSRVAARATLPEVAGPKQGDVTAGGRERAAHRAVCIRQLCNSSLHNCRRARARVDLIGVLSCYHLADLLPQTHEHLPAQARRL